MTRQLSLVVTFIQHGPNVGAQMTNSAIRQHITRRDRCAYGVGLGGGEVVHGGVFLGDVVVADLDRHADVDVVGVDVDQGGQY